MKPVAQARPLPKKDANRSDDGDGDQRDRPHRPMPARPNRNDNCQCNRTEDEPVYDAVNGEHVRAGKSYVKLRGHPVLCAGAPTLLRCVVGGKPGWVAQGSFCSPVPVSR